MTQDELETRYHQLQAAVTANKLLLDALVVSLQPEGREQLKKNFDFLANGFLITAETQAAHPSTYPALERAVDHVRASLHALPR